MKNFLSVLSSTLQGGLRGGLLILALLATSSLWASYSFQSGNLYYYIKNANEVTVTAANDTRSITIPRTVTYDSITYIVTRIGDVAFYDCSSLTSISIPNSITSIGEGAFYRCSSLASINIPNGVTSIGYATFYECSSLTSINIPNSVTSIGEWAFSHCSALTSINIPNGVTSIGRNAFSHCSALTSIHIPNGVTSIEHETFWECSSLSSASIGNSVTSIGENAFWSCSSLTSVNIPNGVTSIKGCAFYRCSALTSISIPNSVTSIEDGAFAHCSALTSIHIPDSVTSIGELTFSSCSSLTLVSIPESVTNIGYRAFAHCSALTSIHIPDSVTSIGDDAFLECSSLTSVSIGNSVTSIGEYAFYSCSKLTSVTIGESVTSIGDYAFEYCTSLTKTNYTGDIAGWCNIMFGNRYANPMFYSHNFYINDQEIKDLVIPNSVTSIGNYAFFSCSSLTSINIPNSITSIGDYAFSFCSSLTSINIPNSITSIGDHAFYCNNLEEIYCYPTTPPDVTEETFKYYNATLYVPCDSKEVYEEHPVFGKFEKIKGIDDCGGGFVTTHIHETICQGEVYEFGEYLCDTTGTYTAIIGDVTTFLYLTVLPSSIDTITVEACDSYEWHGKVYTESGVYTYRDPYNPCVIEELHLTIIPSEEKEYLYIYLNELICDGHDYRDPITGIYRLISSFVPNFLTWSDTITGIEVDTIYTFNITPIVSPEPLTEDMLYAIGSVPKLVAGDKVDIAGTTELIMAYYQKHDKNDIADVIGVEWVAGHDVVLDTEQTTHTMVLEVWDECDYRISKEFTFPVSKKDSEPQDTTIYLPIVYETICEGTTFVWMGMEFTAAGMFISEEIVEDENYIYHYIYTLELTVIPFSSDTIVVEAYDSYEWHGKVYTESGTYIYENYCSIEVLELTIIDTPTPPEPEIPTEGIGVFSVGEGKTVTFSQGNLQYTQSTNTWSFAENQYDYIGTDNVTGGSVSSDPTIVNQKYGDALADKIDLFGWSTSTTNFGVSTSTDYNDYSGNFVDWGTNQIGSDAPNIWRTLTYDEWYYLRHTRTNASSLCGVAQVNGVNGLVFLPDSWTCPEGVTFKSGFSSEWSVAAYGQYQTFTAEQWSLLESAGAVFLPAAGSRGGSNVYNVQRDSGYWSATEDDSNFAYFLYFHSDEASWSDIWRGYGQSVRLVKDISNTTPEPPVEPETEWITIYIDTVICEYDLPFNWHVADHTMILCETAGTYTHEEIVEDENDIYHYIFTLELTVIPFSSDTIVVEAYDSYEWHGKVYTESGTYIYENYCSIEVLELTIIPTLESTIYHPTEYGAICEGGVYEWREREIICTRAGIFEDVETVVENNHIYHHIYTLELFPLNSGEVIELPTTEVTICENELPYVWNIWGTWTITEAGNYMYHEFLDCGEAIYTLELTVIPSEKVVLVEEAYDSYEWHGVVYTESGVYFYEEYCYQEILELTIIPSEDKEYVYEHHNYLVCDADIFVDPITGSTHVISSLIPFSLTWSDTIIGTNIDTIHTFNITPIVSPEPLTEEMLYAIGAAPRLVAGKMVDITGTTDLIMTYYQMVDQHDIADVIGVEWVLGHDVVLDAEQTTHTMVLEVWAQCDYIIPMEFTFPVSKKDSEPQDTTIYISYEDVTICEGITFVWMGMEFTEEGIYTYEEIVVEDDYIYHYIYTLHLMVLPPTLDMYEVTAYDSYEWHGVVYTESGVYTYEEWCYQEILELTIIPSTETAVDNMQTDSDHSAQKILRDQQILILRDGKTYTIMGAEVK